MDDARWVGELRAFGTCVVSDALDRVGLPGAVTGIGPMYPTCPTIAGSAITVSLGPSRSDDPVGAHLATAAIAMGSAEKVIVIDNKGRLDVSSWGGMLTVASSVRDISGVVIDGACRDVAEAEALGFGLFARGLTPVSAKGRTRQLATNDVVSISGVRVAPGDYVVADRNGVAFVPAGSIEAVTAAAQEIDRIEKNVVSSLLTGADPTEAIDDRFITGQQQ